MKIKKIKRKILYSLLISLLIHLGFLCWSYFVKIFSITNEIPPAPTHYLQLKLTNDPHLGESFSKGEKEELEDRTLNPEKSIQSTDMANNFEQDSTKTQQQISSAVDQAQEPPVKPSPDQAPEARIPQVKDEAVHQRVLRATRKNLVEIGEAPAKDTVVGAPTAVAGKDISEKYLENNRADKTNSISPALEYAGSPNGFQTMKKTNSGLQRRLKTADLGSSLTYEISVYQDPKTKEKFFKLQVRVMDMSAVLPVIPKEIVILLDSSRSIGDERLTQFKKGIEYVLKHLNPDDRFNITIFKNLTFPMTPISMSPDEKNIKRAIAFITDFKPGETTDVYSAINGTLNLKDARNPSYRLLLSDGFATEGVTNSRQVINEISDINKGKVGIFAFSGGTFVSQYLLDFIAYKNRGWTQYTNRENLIGEELGKMYDRIRDPLLLNLRYHISGVNAKEVYPKVLPDFFKGSEFVIYGTFTNEDIVAVRLLGDVMGEVKEFYVTASLKSAASGNASIAYQWAFHKVYDLIGQLKHNEKNEEILKSIDGLCDRFHIETPYSRNFR